LTLKGLLRTFDLEGFITSILKKAFSGKLVPQDPNDELAEKLLKRIEERRPETGEERQVKVEKQKSFIKK
jgi:type I restriction enzyme S subunit